MALEQEEIIIKVISGNATQTEEAELKKWRLQTPQNEAMFQKHLALWTKLAEAKTTIYPNAEMAWQQLLNKKGRQRQTWPLTYKIAASLVLLIVAGFVISYFFNSNGNSNTSHIAIKDTSVKVLPNDTSPEIKNRPLNLAGRIIIGKQIFESGDDATQIRLPDQSIAWLEKNSRLVFYTDSTGGVYQRKAEMQGEICFKVSPSKTPFIVSSKFIIVRVVGTVFAVNAVEGHKTHSVSVDEGIVQVSLVNKPEIKEQLLKDDLFTYNIKKETAEVKHEKHKKSRWKKFWSKVTNLFVSSDKK